MTKRKPDPMSRSDISKLGGAATACSLKRHRFTRAECLRAQESSGRIMESRASDPVWAARFKAWGRKGGLMNRRTHA